MRTGQPNQEGFTLLEVLVATVVLGASVAALFSLLSGSLSNARRLQAPEQALLLARSQLNELLAASEQGRAAEPALPLDQRVRGRWSDAFRWEAQANRVPTSRAAVPGEPVLVRIQFDAYWSMGADGGEKRLSLETYQLWQQRGQTAQ
jgi:prepilin-type N-terminal cleavage/methylation domain-containing protein